MSTTDHLGIVEVAASQNQKEVTINDAFNALDDAGNAVLTVLFVANAYSLTSLQFTRNVCFKCGGQTSGAVLTVPLTSRLFAVQNTDGTNSIAVGGTTGLAVTVGPNTTMIILCDGTNCFTITGSSAGLVTSVVGATGAVTLTNLEAGGVMPINDAVPTGTMDASGATAVEVPTIAGHVDSSTKAASTAFVQAVAAANVTSVVGDTGAITLAELVAGGVLPAVNSAPTGTFDGTGASEFKVPAPTNPTDAVTKTYADTLPSIITISFAGKPDSGREVLIPLPKNRVVPNNFAGTVGYAAIAPTSSAIFIVSYVRAGTDTVIGTITVLAASTAITLSIQSSVNLLTGDIFKVTAPAPQDASLANVGITMILN